MSVKFSILFGITSLLLFVFSSQNSVAQIDFESLSDVSDLISVNASRGLLNRRTGEFFVTVDIANESTVSIDGSIILFIDSISSPEVTLTNADGQTPGTQPFFDFSTLVGEDNILSPGEISEPKTVIFLNPSRVRFDVDDGVLGRLPPPGPSSLFPGLKIRVGDGPVASAIADVNGDGILDFVAANKQGSDVSVLLGKSNGVFQQQIRFDVGNDPVSLAVDDVNGDNFPELITANQGSGDITVLFNDGQGMFGNPNNFSAGDGPTAVAVGDIDGDGDMDLVVSHIGVPNGYFLNNGSLDPFSSAVLMNITDDAATTTSIALGDVNGDGDLDVVAGNQGGINRLYLNNGTIDPFAGVVGFNVSDDADLTLAIALGDMDDDGDLDVVTGNVAGFNRLYLNNGNTIDPFNGVAALNITEDPDASTAIVLADMDGNGSPDVLVGNEGTANRLYLNNGTVNPFVDVAGINIVDDENATSSLAVGDINQDGFLDVTIADQPSNDVLAVFGKGTGLFHTRTQLPTQPAPVSIALGDVNGDGIIDIATANINSNDVSVFKGIDGETFEDDIRFPVGDSPFSIVLGDMNGDDILDISTANAFTSNVSILLGVGDGTFQSQSNFPVGLLPNELDLADLNRDGHLDMAVVNAAPETVSILLGSGDGTIETETSFPVGGFPVAIALGDVNGDGFLDVFTANSDTGSNDISVLIGNGDGTFQNQNRFPVGTSPESVAVGDFNGDGANDIATANFDSSDVSVLLGNGDGSFQSEVRFPVGDMPQALELIDINGDGFLDIFTVNLISGDLSALAGNGDGTFQDARTFSVGDSPQALVINDVNGDTFLDIAIASESTGVSILFQIPPQ